MVYRNRHYDYQEVDNKSRDAYIPTKTTHVAVVFNRVR